MVCGVFVWQVPDEWMLVPGRTSRLLGLVGSRIDCWHTHTGLYKVTDAGLKAFSAALGSSTTITTVWLDGKYAFLTCCCTCGRVWSVSELGVVWCVCV